MPAPETLSSQRLDLWLWHARFFKTRSLAAGLCRAGRIRIDSRLTDKASYAVHPGHVLTFPQGSRIRVVRILGISPRRGPATEAQALYEDLDTPAD